MAMVNLRATRVGHSFTFRMCAPAGVSHLLGLLLLAITILGVEYMYIGTWHQQTSLSHQDLIYSGQTAYSSQKRPLLQNLFVAISFHYDIQRLSYLYENLETISRWQTRVDCCIGTNEPEKLLAFLHNASLATSFTQKVTICPLQDLSFPYLLNWRTRESMEVAFASPLNYTAFIFVEDDLFVTWDALLKWDEDIQILQPHNFTRTFFRYEISPKDGRPYSLDYVGKGTHRVKTFFRDDIKRDARVFVQAGGEASYSGMFVATRELLSRFIASSFWSYVPNTFCCYYGGREDASWKIQSIDVPNGWEKTGLLPFDASSGRVDDRALLFHRPNNYFAREEGWNGQPLELVNDAFKDIVRLE